MLEQFPDGGKEAYQTVVKFIKLRYTLRPYILKQMKIVADTGVPVNRPLSFDFPEDTTAWNVTDQFMFGPQYMTAPVYHLGARARTVYFPRSDRCPSWKAYAGAGGSDTAVHKGGDTALVVVPLDELAMYECVPGPALPAPPAPDRPSFGTGLADYPNVLDPLEAWTFDLGSQVVSHSVVWSFRHA